MGEGFWRNSGWGADVRHRSTLAVGGKGGQEGQAVMANVNRGDAAIHEVVASLPTRRSFDRAVDALRAAGFAAADISVLGSHDSLATATGEPDATVGLSREIKYIEPMTAAGIILLSGGPIAAPIAAVLGAGLGGAALVDLLDSYTAPRHRSEFAQAVKAGAILLWVRADTPDRVALATGILAEVGGRQVHLNARPAEASGRPAPESISSARARAEQEERSSAAYHDSAESQKGEAPAGDIEHGSKDQRAKKGTKEADR